MTSQSRRPMGYCRWLGAGALCAPYSLRHPRNENRLKTSILTGIAALLLFLLLTLVTPLGWAQPLPLSPETAAAQALLQPGDSGPRVEQLQRELAQRRFYLGEVDGIYGVETAEAVRSLQRQQELTVDGIAGAETWQALASLSGMMHLPVPLLQADLLTLTPLVVAAPPPPPSSLWLALMPLVPISGGLLTYLYQRLQRRQQLRRRRTQRRLPPNHRLPR